MLCARQIPLMRKHRREPPSAPYEPAYSGFDKDATQRAHETVDRASATRGARGEDANAEYWDLGPAEAARRLGVDPKSLADSIERAFKRTLRGR